jgi:hypothetical protein
MEKPANAGFPIVSVAGGYWTGSSAAFDLLNEHPGCCSLPEEFALLSYGQIFEELQQLVAGVGPGSMSDLDGSIRRLLAFNRSERFYPLRPVLRRLCAALGLYPTALTALRAGMGARLGSDYRRACDSFVESVRRRKQAGGDDTRIRRDFGLMLHSIAAAVDPAPGKPVVLDQFIAPAYAEAGLHFAPGLKCIFVDRDWRDQYVEVRSFLKSMITSNARLGVRPSGEASGDYGLPEMEFFIRLRQRLHQCRQLHEAQYRDRILWLNFEQIVGETKLVAERAFAFIGLDATEWTPNACFRPESSRKNIGKWRSSIYTAEIEQLARVLPVPR